MRTPPSVVPQPNVAPIFVLPFTLVLSCTVLFIYISKTQPSVVMAQCGTTAQCGYLHSSQRSGHKVTLLNENTARCSIPAQCGILFSFFHLSFIM